MFADIARDDIFHLETPRLWLRWPRASDAVAIARYCSLWDVARYTARIPHPYPEGSAERFIFAARAGNAAGSQMVLTVTPIGGKRESIGSVALEERAGGHLSLGYVLSPDHWGRGLMSEAVAAMIDAGFRLTKAREIDANVFVENLGSRRVLEHNGFQFRGAAPCGAPARGGMVDSERFSLDRLNWEARRLLPFAAPPDFNLAGPHEIS